MRDCDKKRGNASREIQIRPPQAHFNSDLAINSLALSENLARCGSALFAKTVHFGFRPQTMLSIAIVAQNDLPRTCTLCASCSLCRTKVSSRTNSAFCRPPKIACGCHWRENGS